MNIWVPRWWGWRMLRRMTRVGRLPAVSFVVIQRISEDWYWWPLGDQGGISRSVKEALGEVLGAYFFFKKLLRRLESRLLCEGDFFFLFTWFWAGTGLISDDSSDREKSPYGSVCAWRQKWPFNVLFLKVEPPCDQTWWDSLVFSIPSCFSYVSHAENTLVGPVGPF